MKVITWAAMFTEATYNDGLTYDLTPYQSLSSINVYTYLTW